MGWGRWEECAEVDCALAVVFFWPRHLSPHLTALGQLQHEPRATALTWQMPNHSRDGILAFPLNVIESSADGATASPWAKASGAGFPRVSCASCKRAARRQGRRRHPLTVETAEMPWSVWNRHTLRRRQRLGYSRGSSVANGILVVGAGRGDGRVRLHVAAHKARVGVRVVVVERDRVAPSACGGVVGLVEHRAECGCRDGRARRALKHRLHHRRHQTRSINLSTSSSGLERECGSTRRLVRLLQSPDQLCQPCDAMLEEGGQLTA
ncbi:hypothetical protein L1887_49087 [Cichorium endivia]|nr:hypothetical protein L1887_49087 [Cichorium endivia]